MGMSKPPAPRWDNIPQDLASRQQWLLWRLETKGKQAKASKVPYYACGKRRSGTQGSDDDRQRLVTLEHARRAYERGTWSGVGFAFLPDDGFVGIDIDNGVDPASGEAKERTQQIIDAAASFTETSVSGAGVHIYGKGKTHTNKCNDIGVELFCERQFFIVTGNTWPGAPKDVRKIDAKVLDRLHATIDQGKGKRRTATPTSAPQRGTESAAELQERIEAALAVIDPDLDYSDWISIGWALREALGDAAFRLWDTWSSSGSKYSDTETLRGHWRSFETGGKTAHEAAGVIFARAKEFGHRPMRESRQPASTAAVADDWPEPLHSSAEAPDIPATVLPGWLGQFVEALAESTQTPAALSTMFALSAVAACVQRRYAVQPLQDDPDYIEEAALWSLSLAPSGARKSAIVKALTAPHLRWEKHARDHMRREIAANQSRRLAGEAAIKRLQGQAGKSEDAQERERLREQIQRELEDMPERLHAPLVFIGDGTVERVQTLLPEQHGRVAVLSDEAGMLNTAAATYGGGAGPALDVLLQGYSGGDVRVERASRQSYVDRACVTIGLMLQNDLVREAAGSNRFRASGLMARFCYVVPRRFVGGRDVRKYVGIPPAARKAYEQAIEELLGDPTDGPHLQPSILVLDGDAREHWLNFAQEVENGLAPGGNLAAISDWGAKLAGTAARIALIFELIAQGPDAQWVTAPSVQRAVALCRLLIPHARAAFRLLAVDEVDRDVDAVLEWIRGRSDKQRFEFKQSELHKALHGRFTKRERLVATLQRLAADGCLKHMRVKNKGARATDWWRVNPRLFPAFPEVAIEE